MKSVIIVLFIALSHSVVAQNNNYLYKCNEKLIEVVMEDLFSPPVACRVYVYPNIAAYEVLAVNHPEYRSLSGQIKHLPDLELKKADINYSIAAEFAYTTVAKKYVFSEKYIEQFELDEIAEWKKCGNDSDLVSRSVAYGRNAGKKIIDWATKDNYIKVKTMQRYELKEGLDKWRPTAPEYTNALEPNWSKMRTLVLDSSSEIKALAPLPYSEKKNSDFYKSAFAVYNTKNKLDTLQSEIAAFWDCNPNISYQRGHSTVFVHKISPGAHWIRIAGQAINNTGLFKDEMKQAEVYALITIGLFDSFIRCWTEKFSLNTIRPETYIQRIIDPEFRPFIQTPPFPEYPSGHSMISATSAELLTQLIPQPYAFTDSAELYIGLPARSFNSFSEAAREASLSRFYGGIHFMPALDNGAVLGKQVGELVRKRLQTKK